ncbi:MAG: hypothetical protein HYX36_01930 [Rhizobiales bacterium]|nr:hypothetical protein [Hyphomicrobiales bacterium]
MDDYRLDPLWLRLAFLERQAGDSRLSLPHLAAKAERVDIGAARRLVEEYRRFLFLAMRAGHAVTPPAPIERVMRQHEAQDPNYWEALAGMIVERPLVDGAASTTESYQKIFGEPPPVDIWSSSVRHRDFLRRLWR